MKNPRLVRLPALIRQSLVLAVGSCKRDRIDSKNPLVKVDQANRSNVSGAAIRCGFMRSGRAASASEEQGIEIRRTVFSSDSPTPLAKAFVVHSPRLEVRSVLSGSQCCQDQSITKRES